MRTPPVLRVVEREARVFRRLWRGTMVTGFVTPILFLAAMGLGLGGLVQSHTGHVQGLSYLHFVTPGLLAASVMQAAAGESLWPVLAGTKWVRFYHGVVATPLTSSDLYSGMLVWVSFRTTLQASAFIAVAALLGGVASPWGVLAVPAAVLGALALAAPLIAYAATQDTDLTFPVIMRMGVLPLFLFSGTFFPVSRLPAGLRPIVQLSPLYHAVELCRAATGGTVGMAALAHVAVLLAWVGAGRLVGRRTFQARLAP